MNPKSVTRWKSLIFCESLTLFMDFRYWFTFFWFCILDQLNFLRRKMLMQRNSIKIYRWTTINDPSWLSNVPLSRLIEHEMLTCSLLSQSNWESMNSGAAHPTKADKGTWSNKDTLDNHVAISAFLRDSGENGRIDIQLGICRVSALNTVKHNAICISCVSTKYTPNILELLHPRYLPKRRIFS